MKKIVRLVLLIGLLLGFSLGPTDALASPWPHHGHHGRGATKNRHHGQSQIKHPKKPKAHARHRA